MALTGQPNPPKQLDSLADKTKFYFEVENGEEIYTSAITSLRTLNNATAANRGRLGAFTGAPGELPVGEHLSLQEPAYSQAYGDNTFDGSVTGNTSAAEPPKAGVASDFRIYRRQTVAGVSDITAQGRHVFLVDDNTWTLTPQTRPVMAGYILRRHDDDTCDIAFFGPTMLMAGAGIQRLWINRAAAALDGGAGDIITGFPMPCAGFLLGIGLEVGVAATGSPANVISLEVDGNDVTGGTLTVDTSAAGAYRVAGTFASVNHYFSRGSLLDIESDAGAAGGGSPTAFFFVDIVRLPSA